MTDELWVPVRAKADWEFGGQPLPSPFLGLPAVAGYMALLYSFFKRPINGTDT
ncbi:hypothetical protein SAMN05216167_12150 [Spirosoma endophyticum]|uniref:Uncharacterized protein n=1 Tax=Spirosoma endophyticum TaxID=662367 RepID=A0A1I2E8F7_9BACT|nr:hypothetical protein SAMN05216167_12150 [Spirosoma endophyticum]